MSNFSSLQDIFRMLNWVSLLVWDGVRLFKAISRSFHFTWFGGTATHTWHVSIHWAYPEVDNIAWLIIFLFWIYETSTLQWPWGDLRLTQMLHAQKGPPCRVPHVYIWLIHLVDPQLPPLYQNTCISIKLPPLSLDHGMNLRVKGLAQLKLRYEWDREWIYIFFNYYRAN